MQSGQRRTAAIAVAVLALLGAGFGSLAVRRVHARGLRRLAGQMGGNARSLAQKALDKKLEWIESKAMSAANLPQIGGQIATFDAPTLKDGFRTEAWVAP